MNPLPAKHLHNLAMQPQVRLALLPAYSVHHLTLPLTHLLRTICSKMNVKMMRRIHLTSLSFIGLLHSLIRWVLGRN